MEFGGLRGLTFNTGQDKLIEDLKYFDQQARQNEAMNMAKAKMFADDIEFQTASNPFDAALVKQEGEQLLTELGKIRSENPNWNTDPNVLALMKFKKQGLKSSPAVLRSMAYKQAMEDYTKDLAAAQQNPDEYDVEALNQFEIQRKNYEQFGHPMGAEAAKKEGFTPLTYKAPEKFIDKTKYFAELGSKIPANKRVRVNGGYEFVPDEALVDQLAEQALQDRPRQWEVQYRQKGVDPKEAIKSELLLFAPKKFVAEPPNELWLYKQKKMFDAQLEQAKAAQSQGAPVDPYVETIIKSQQITPSNEAVIAETFGSTPQYVFTGPDGKMAQGSGDRFYYESLYDANIQRDEKGNIKPYKKNGLKIADGYVLKPMAWAEENNILEDKWFDGKDDVIKPEFRGQYEIIYPDPKSDVRVVKVRARTMPINSNSAEYSSRFNEAIKRTTAQRSEIANQANLMEGQSETGTYQGYRIGSIVKTDAGDFLVTPSGYVKQ